MLSWFKGLKTICKIKASVLQITLEDVGVWMTSYVMTTLETLLSYLLLINLLHNFIQQTDWFFYKRFLFDKVYTKERQFRFVKQKKECTSKFLSRIEVLHLYLACLSPPVSIVVSRWFVFCLYCLVVKPLVHFLARWFRSVAVVTASFDIYI